MCLIVKYEKWTFISLPRKIWTFSPNSYLWWVKFKIQCEIEIRTYKPNSPLRGAHFYISTIVQMFLTFWHWQIYGRKEGDGNARKKKPEIMEYSDWKWICSVKSREIFEREGGVNATYATYDVTTCYGFSPRGRDFFRSFE